MRPSPFPIAQTIAPPVFGTDPVRFWSFGEAPQKPQTANGYPYAVWQHIIGLPYNSLNCVPSLAQHTIQIDIYAKTPQTLTSALNATFAAFADAATVNTVRDWPREAETQLYRATLEVDMN